jgi:hypothetical protein
MRDIVAVNLREGKAGVVFHTSQHSKHERVKFLDVLVLLAPPPPFIAVFQQVTLLLIIQI